jgi:hypothetical protein
MLLNCFPTHGTGVVHLKPGLDTVWVKDVLAVECDYRLRGLVFILAYRAAISRLTSLLIRPLLQPADRGLARRRRTLAIWVVLSQMCQQVFETHSHKHLLSIRCRKHCRHRGKRPHQSLQNTCLTMTERHVHGREHVSESVSGPSLLPGPCMWGMEEAIEHSGHPHVRDDVGDAKYIRRTTRIWNIRPRLLLGYASRILVVVCIGLLRTRDRNRTYESVLADLWSSIHSLSH